MGIKEPQSTVDAEDNLEARARLFKALGHSTRLLIVNLIRLKPRHGEELAEILRLNPATISHHLTQLSEVGLLQSEKSQYYQIYSLRVDALGKTLGEFITLPQPEISATFEPDAYRKKVINTFFEYGRLKQIPAQLKKRQVILSVIATEFEPDQAYTEIEINRILLEFHEDVATLRQGLVSEKLMERSKGIYRRVVFT